MRICNMGDQRAYESGRNDYGEYLYKTVSPKVTINGVTGKMVEKKAIHNDRHNTLPAYAQTSDVYFAKGPDGFACQCKVYNKEKKMVIDFDWDHDHNNKDGSPIFKKGTIHVQTYTITRRFSEKDHKWHDHFIRSKARKMTQAEIEKYGPIIKHFNPNVKF